MNHDAHILYVFDVVVDDKTMIKTYWNVPNAMQEINWRIRYE